MDAKEIAKIKEYQRDFEQLFGKKLYISWPEMNGVEMELLKPVEEPRLVSLEEVLKECAEKYGADIELIKSREKRLHCLGSEKERAAIIEYSKFVVKNRANMRKAAKLINRDRTLIYHYAKDKEKVLGMW